MTSRRVTKLEKLHLNFCLHFLYEKKKDYPETRTKTSQGHFSKSAEFVTLKREHIIGEIHYTCRNYGEFLRQKYGKQNLMGVKAIESRKVCPKFVWGVTSEKKHVAVNFLSATHLKWKSKTITQSQTKLNTRLTV